MHVRDALREIGIKVDIKPDYRYKGIRSYRVSTEKIEKILNFRPTISVEESVKEMVEKINRYGYTDFDNPRYYNIKWRKLLEEAEKIIRVTGSVFEVPGIQEPRVVKIRERLWNRKVEGLKTVELCMRLDQEGIDIEIPKEKAVATVNYGRLW